MPGTACHSVTELSLKPREEHPAHLVIQFQPKKELQLRGVQKVAQSCTATKWLGTWQTAGFEFRL